jgi:SAM-dependent methyltransferase
MHPLLYNEFEAICSTLAITGRVLEIGASLDHPLLLKLPALRSASQRIGVGSGPAHLGDGFELLQADANNLTCFADNSFELTISNATLEHDARFWLTAAEMLRVTEPRGWVLLGAPGFGAMGSVPVSWLVKKLSQMPFIGHHGQCSREALEASAPTLGLHYFPSDYYRFSEHAMADVLLDGLEDKQVRQIMTPPRIIGLGRKPRVSA